MITYQSKNDSEKLPADRHKGLHPKHAPAHGALIPFMQHSTLTDGAQGRKVQKLSHERSAALGDAKLAPVLPRADFIQVKPGKLHNFADSAKFREVSYFTDQPCRSDSANPFKRKNHAAVRDLLQVPRHVNLQTFDEAAIPGDGIKHQFDLKKHAATTVSDADRFVCSLKEPSGSVFLSFSLLTLRSNAVKADSPRATMSSGVG